MGIFSFQALTAFTTGQLQYIIGDKTKDARPSFIKVNMEIAAEI
jgi:hypothetical protein